MVLSALGKVNPNVLTQRVRITYAAVDIDAANQNGTLSIHSGAQLTA